MYVSNGTTGPRADFAAPVAAYRHTEPDPLDGTRDWLILVQHGSYFIGGIEVQPHADCGGAIVYRGIRKAETFHLYRLTNTDLRERVRRVHASSLTGSVLQPRAMRDRLFE